MEYLESDYEHAEYLQTLLVNAATQDGPSDNSEYQLLRKKFLANPNTKELLPSWVKTKRNLSQYWEFIKNKYPTYHERREFIWSEFNPLLEFFENKKKSPGDQNISGVLQNFNSDNVHLIWTKALERKKSDPEGSITIARTLLETVCKHILDMKNIPYSDKNIDLPKLYHLVSKELNIAPEQHSEEIFKKILGGCLGVVNGLGDLRNEFGDAHGNGVQSVRPGERHAELAVNLAGSMAQFLIETWEYNQKKSDI